MRKYLKVVIALVFIVALAAACEDGDPENASSRDEHTAQSQLARYQEAQPAPEFDWSQVRQNLIEIETAQVQSTQTTTFFFNQGTDAPIGQCPSIGYPIPTTNQLTNPSQVVEVDTPGQGGAAVTTGQIEQTGVFTGDSTGTYVMCVNGNGEAYAFYWEGFVAAVSGAAEFANGEIRLIGDPSFDFSEREG